MSFATSAEVRFGDVDAAGIVFYPRYFEMLSRAMEDWCARGLGMDYRTMHQLLGMGIPTVAINATFAAPSMLGDILTVRITPLAIGNSSCQVEVDFTCAGEPRLTILSTIVWMDLAMRKSQPWPDGLRAKIEDGIVLTDRSGAEQTA